MFNKFKVVPVSTIIQNSIDEHERGLISEEAKASYHAKMAEYHEEELIRLNDRLAAETSESVAA